MKTNRKMINLLIVIKYNKINNANMVNSFDQLYTMIKVLL